MYKAIKNGKPVDYLDKIIYVKFQHKNSLMVACDENEAEGFVSSNGKFVYGLKETKIRHDGLVELVEITQEEYDTGILTLNEYGIEQGVYNEIMQIAYKEGVQSA